MRLLQMRERERHIQQPRIYAMLGITVSQEGVSTTDAVHYALQWCNAAHSAILSPDNKIK